MSRPYPGYWQRDVRPLHDAFSVRPADIRGPLINGFRAGSRTPPGSRPTLMWRDVTFRPFCRKQICCVGFGSASGTMMKDAVWAICERVAEVKALLEEHLEHGKYQTQEVPWLINEILSEDGLLEAMLAVGYLEAKSARH